MKTKMSSLPPAVIVCSLLWWAVVGSTAYARPNIRDAFFSAYPSAVGTRLDNLPSKTTHCGVCHFDFNGGGARNPFGLSVEAALSNYPNTVTGRSNAVWSVRNLDSDGDAFTNHFEITNRTYNNTPTFPGLRASNLGQVVNISLSEIQNYLTPANTVDTTPPVVTVTKPNGSEIFTGNRSTNITWTATDASGIASVSIYVSLDGGLSYDPVALNLPHTGTYSWFPANRPTTFARIRVVALDNSLNSGQDQSDANFTIISPPGGRVPTTLRDFDLPGTQPFEGGHELASPADCASCHGNYNPSTEPFANWQGSMMAHAARDPLFLANMTIANQDAPDSGDLCLRCHFPRGWMAGRSVPTDGSRMVAEDHAAVSCAMCHQMVDPIFDPLNPTNDFTILSALKNPGTNFGNGMFVIDPTATQRGPYTNAAAPHTFLHSPFHKEAALCGTCHDVSNPAFYKDAQGNYVPNAFNLATTNTSAHSMLPVERTYSEWLNSEYNTPLGVYAPQFAGTKPDGRVATCQDCHMRGVSGYGANPANNPGVPLRNDLPLHDMTGGTTWLLGLMTNLFPNDVSVPAVQAGIQRATYMLENAAEVSVAKTNGQLRVRVVNNTGHKLPTGYPEGRRIWLNAKFFNAANALLGESGAYNTNTGVLNHDAQAKVYEIHLGIETNLANALGLPPGPSFHFVLNNQVFLDNRIPPRGFSNANFAVFGGAPVGHSYADGQYWDDTFYTLPTGATRAEVQLFYQSTSKEFIEFLRDENTTDSRGQEMFDLWNNNGKCPPTLMAAVTWTPVFEIKSAQFTPQGKFQIQFTSRVGVTYTIQYTDALSTNTVWHAFQNNGTLTATNTTSVFEDDFTGNTSGGPSPSGARFYRFSHNGTP